MEGIAQGNKVKTDARRANIGDGVAAAGNWWRATTGDHNFIEHCGKTNANDFLRPKSKLTLTVGTGGYSVSSA
jgi:hypothetical protein